MIKRLRKRFIRIAMLSVALVMTLLTVLVNGADLLSTDARLSQLLQMICDNRGSFPQQRPDGVRGGRHDGALTPETPFSTRFFVLIYTAEGELTQADLGSIAAVTPEGTGPYLAAAAAHGVGNGYLSGYRYRVVLREDGQYMAVFLDCHQELRSIKTLALMTLLAETGCLALVYALVVLFSKRAIDPVVRAAARQKQFITDAGHELKTPLTVITTCLKVLELEVGRQKWIDKAQAQTERLGELVSSLVTLSRLDEEEPPITLIDFDLSAAVAETAESFRACAGEAGHELKTDIAPALSYHGDEAALRQLTAILLDNAVKYASPGGTIALSLRRERRALCLRALNPCPPLEPGEPEKLFDRFYRADKARSGTVGGFGVGLSIARSIAEAHGGDIRAACPETGVIEFTVTLR